MTWFKVDDGLHSHPKAMKAMRGSASSMSLWVLAGSYCADQLTDGWITEEMAARLAPRTWRKDARALVDAELWQPQQRGGERGWVFHQWDEPGRQPTRAQILRERAETAERVRAHRERKRGNATGNATGNAVRNGERNEGSNRVGNGGRTAVPTRPGPTRSGQGGGSAHGGGPPAEPPRQCPEHLDNPNPPPCGPCADARRTHDRWETDRANRIAYAPKCRKHRGQLADNCALCRSEQLAREAS